MRDRGRFGLICFSSMCCGLFCLILVVGCYRPQPVKAPRVVEDQIDFTGQPLQFKDCNLVFVSVDALQAAHVGCLGYSRDTTPNLDAIAHQSCVFTNTISAASWTVPSSMTWFTGVYPSEHGLTNKFAVFNAQEQRPAQLSEASPNLRTLAEILREQGYATSGFTGNAGVSGPFGFRQGFDEYHHQTGKFGGFEDSISKAIAWVQRHQADKFFIFLHGYDAHGQYMPAEGFDYRFVDKRYDRKFSGSRVEQEVLREEGLDRGSLNLREEDVRFWRAIYDEKIQRADEKLRAFFAEFDRLELTRRTLFVVTSDHGTEFYEHRRFDHGFTLYQEQLHVPLLIRLPGQSQCRVIPERVSSIDLLPTILDLLEIDLPEPAATQLRGSSLVPAIQGEPPRHDLFSETNYREYTYKRSIIAPDGWKLVYTLESRSRELYDLNTDPSEQNNLAQAEPKRADELEARLFAHFDQIGHNLRSRTWETGFNPVYSLPAKAEATK
jgi:choline-sulfatase